MIVGAGRWCYDWWDVFFIFNLNRLWVVIECLPELSTYRLNYLKYNDFLSLSNFLLITIFVTIYEIYIYNFATFLLDEINLYDAWHNLLTFNHVGTCKLSPSLDLAHLTTGLEWKNWLWVLEVLDRRKDRRGCTTQRMDNINTLGFNRLDVVHIYNKYIYTNRRVIYQIW